MRGSSAELALTGDPPLLEWLSLTRFLHDTSFSSRAPTLRSRSPTMFNADTRADGVKGASCCWPLALGDELAEHGGVSNILAVLASDTVVSLLEFTSPTLFLDVMKDLLLLSFVSSTFLSLSGRSMEVDESSEEKFACLPGARTRSSDLRSRVSSFILWTAAFSASFSSNSDSRKALRSMATFNRASKSSSDAMVLLQGTNRPCQTWFRSRKYWTHLFALSKSSFCCSRSRTYLLS